jgi:hypothetical protein
MHTADVQFETPRKGRFSWGSLLRLAGLMCLGLSWLMPNHYLPWYFFHTDAMAFLAVFAWLLSLQLEDPETSSHQVPRLALFVLAIAALPWAQVAGGLLGFAGEAWIATLYLGGFAASIFVGFAWARQSDVESTLLETVAAAILFAALVSTGLCLIQWLRLEEWLGIFVGNLGDTGRPFANLLQPNLLGTLMVMSVVVLAWLYEARRIGGWGLGLGGVFLTVGLSFTQSRAGYMSALAVITWWFFKGAAQQPARMRRWWAPAWLLLLATFSAILPRLSVALDLAGHRPVSLFDNNGRWLMWKQIARGIIESPWVGYGWDHTPAAQMAGSITYPGKLATGYAHNIALDAMAWLGVPLGLLLCLAGAIWLVRRARSIRDRVPVFALALALPVIVHSVFEFPFAYAVFLFPVGIMVGVIEGSHRDSATVKIARVWMLAFSVALAALGWQVAREYVLAEDDFRFLRFEALRMGTTPASHSRPDFLLLTQMDALLEVGRIKPAPGMSAEQIERVRYVTVKYSWAPPSFLYAAVLEANGLRAQAARQMQIVNGMYGRAFYTDASARLGELRDQWRDGASIPRR